MADGVSAKSRAAAEKLPSVIARTNAVMSAGAVIFDETSQIFIRKGGLYWNRRGISLKAFQDRRLG
jgi:hypothetical protein